MKKHTQRQSADKPVTFSQLKQVFKVFERKMDKKMDDNIRPLDRKMELAFRQIDARFKDVDARFKEMGGWFQAAQSIHAMYTDRAIHDLEERQNKKFDAILTKMDDFIKRSVANEREILFLGEQHDDLAKYCTDKIGYPTYGRK